MSLVVKTPDPEGLLENIKAGNATRKIRTWTCNAKGNFTHSPQQWRDQAWLKPIVRRGCLHFLVLLPAGEAKQGVAGVYQGRFAEMLQNHFQHTAVESSNPDDVPVRSKASGTKKTLSQLKPKRSK